MNSETHSPNHQKTSNLLKAVVLAMLTGFALVGIFSIVSPYFTEVPAARMSVEKPIEKAVTAAKPENVTLLTGQPLLDELRKGKLVIFMRHFESDHRKWHEDPIKSDHLEMSLEDFANSGDKQRHLSDYGRMRAKLVGEGMRKLQVPVGKVISSPYIRAVEGATLLAGRAPDLITKDLLHRGGNLTATMMVENITPYLSTPVAEGGNTILMSHRTQMDNIYNIEEGQMFVFRPLGDGKFDMIGGIYDTDWTEAQVSVDLLGARYVKLTLEGEDTAIKVVK